MSVMIPNAAKQVWMARALYNNAGAENLTLKLFTNNITPAETDVASTYTEATFTGYSAVTLTSSQAAGTWAAPTVSANLANSVYGTLATYTITASTQTVYGIFAIFASSLTIAFSQAFGAGKALSSGAVNDQITITPSLQFGHL